MDAPVNSLVLSDGHSRPVLGKVRDSTTDRGVEQLRTPIQHRSMIGEGAAEPDGSVLAPIQRDSFAPGQPVGFEVRTGGDVGAVADDDIPADPQRPGDDGGPAVSARRLGFLIGDWEGAGWYRVGPEQVGSRLPFSAEKSVTRTWRFALWAELLG